MPSLTQFCCTLFLAFSSVLYAQVPSDIIRQMIDNVSVERLSDHVLLLQHAGGHGSRVNFTPGNDSAVQYVFQQFKQMPGLTSVVLDTFYIPAAQSPYHQHPLYNVVATIKGKNHSQYVVVIGAHIDCSGSKMKGDIWNTQWNTISVPGADDNASGVAAIIELAAVMSDTANHFQNDHTLIFIAFGAEEGGVVYPGSLFGSTRFAQNSKMSNENILAMASLDMIGFNDLNTMYLNIAANDASQWLGKHIVAVNDTFSVGLTLNAPPFAFGEWSDHAPFWKNGYSAVCLIENAPPWITNPFYRANPHYHTGSDTAGTLNVELMKRAVQLTIASFAELPTPVTRQTQTAVKTPAHARLEQNYPNPFNSSTRISFTVDRAQKVSLIVYDILGAEIEKLVDGALPAGTHSIDFHAAAAANGIYYFRLIVEGKSEIKKMVLIR